MGNNFKFGIGPVNYTPTCANQNPSYPAGNLKLYNNLRRPLRSANTGATTIAIASGAGALVYLADCNFTSVSINGSNYTLSKEGETERYNLCAIQSVPASFNIVPSSPLAGETYYRIGTLVIAGTVFEPARNPSYGYLKTAEKQYESNAFRSGGEEIIKLGDYKRWKRKLSFKGVPAANESDLWTLNEIDQDEFIVFFENRGNTSKAWLCRRGELSIDEARYNIVESTDIILKECI